jgi:hypothetical protein
MKPHLAYFKDGDEIRKLAVQVVSRVETIKKTTSRVAITPVEMKDWEKFAVVFCRLRLRMLTFPSSMHF